MNSHSLKWLFFLHTRIVSASENDANLNAICSLTYVSMGVANSLDDNLKELRKLFFPEGSGS